MAITEREYCRLAQCCGIFVEGEVEGVGYVRPVAMGIVKVLSYAEKSLNMILDVTPNVSRYLRFAGRGWSHLNLFFDGRNLLRQSREYGLRNINPIDAIRVGAGGVSATAGILSWLGIGGKTTLVVGAAGSTVGKILIGMTPWILIYKNLYKLQFVPLYDDGWSCPDTGLDMMHRIGRGDFDYR